MKNQFGRFPQVLLFTVGFFLLAFPISVVLPVLSVSNQDEETADFETLAADPSGSGFAEFAANEDYREDFLDIWREGVTPANYAEALEQGVDVYIENACYTCHTQNVREVDGRYGNPSTVIEQNNDTQQPPVLGNRRIGPDLSRVGARYNVDVLVNFLYDPTSVDENSSHPGYEWLFDEEDDPNEDGYSLISYILWLGDYQPIVVSDDDAESDEGAQ